MRSLQMDTLTPIRYMQFPCPIYLISSVSLTTFIAVSRTLRQTPTPSNDAVRAHSGLIPKFYMSQSLLMTRKNALQYRAKHSTKMHRVCYLCLNAQLAFIVTIYHELELAH